MPRGGQGGWVAWITRLGGSRDGAPENRDSRDAALELGRTRNRLLRRESLVRTRLVVEAHELGDEASEVVLAEEEDVVEQLPAQGARETVRRTRSCPVPRGQSARHAPLTMPERG